MAAFYCQFTRTIPNGRRKQRKSWSAQVRKIFPQRVKPVPKRAIRPVFAKLPRLNERMLLSFGRRWQLPPATLWRGVFSHLVLPGWMSGASLATQGGGVHAYDFKGFENENRMGIFGWTGYRRDCRFDACPAVGQRHSGFTRWQTQGWTGSGRIRR